MDVRSSREPRIPPWHGLCTRDTWAREFDFLARGPLADETAESGLAHRSAVDIFAGVHQGKQGTEDAGFQFVGHRKTAGGHMHERFAAVGYLGDEFHLAFVT